MKQRIAIATVFLLGLCAAREAQAFCGFYISGAGGEMFNNATQVVLMRHGTRTVLSMQNNYQGPPTEFAMVVPVPVVLQESDVKTLTADVFKRVDTMGSPRLVEYWEQDPCTAPDDRHRRFEQQMGSAPPTMEAAKSGGYGVTVEAQFTVGEYEIVILSATESTGLDRYLRDQKYKIPAGAEPLLRPYVESGSKFFVAKVNPNKVKFENGQVMLSPLRFHYDSDEFSLPIRLGLANAPAGGTGKQDLIVSILSPMQRYELANYKNVTIPTNLDVKEGVRDRFGEFYAALFDRTVEQNPGAIVTEYAWMASSCDPCPGPSLNFEDFATLGADVLGGDKYHQFVLTRLHARYGRDGAPNDLVFRKGAPLVGGREHRNDDGTLEERGRVEETGINNFQGRYAIRHKWTGPIRCQNPKRGVWGGPPRGEQRANQAATNTAFAPRGNIELAKLVAQDVPEIGVKQSTQGGCGCAAGEGEENGLAGGAIGSGLMVVVLGRRRRKEKR